MNLGVSTVSPCINQISSNHSPRQSVDLDLNRTLHPHPLGLRQRPPRLCFVSGALPALPAHLWGSLRANQLSLPGSDDGDGGI